MLVDSLLHDNFGFSADKTEFNAQRAKEAAKELIKLMNTDQSITINRYWQGTRFRELYDKLTSPDKKKFLTDKMRRDLEQAHNDAVQGAAGV